MKSFVSLEIPEFRHLIAGRFLFIVSLRMMSTLVGWWIYQLTNAPFAIGLVGLSEVIPALSLALYAGHVIDKTEKRTLLRRGILLYICIVAVLIFVAWQHEHHALTNIQVSISIYLAIFCTGIVRSFVAPVFNVTMPLIVPKSILPNAITVNQAFLLTASVTGHALGGFCIALIGNMGTLFCVAAGMLTSFAIVSFLKPKPPAIENIGKKTWDSVKEGLRFVYKTKDLLAAISLDMFAVFFGGAVAMVPVFAKDILDVGPKGFGLLNSAADTGAIITVLMLTIFPLKRKQGKILIAAVAGFGVCILLFGLSKWFLLSYIALLLCGILDGISVVIRGTIMQLKTPNEMKGRVMSVNSMFVNSSNELGQFESGLMAKLLGVVPSVIFGGMATIAVAASTWFSGKKLKELEY